MARALSLVALLLVCVSTPAIASRTVESTDLRVTVVDSSGRPVPGAVVTIRIGKQVLAKTSTDPTGSASIQSPADEGFDIVASKADFEDAVLKSADVKGPIKLTLDPAAAHESIQVSATATAVEEGASA